MQEKESPWDGYFFARDFIDHDDDGKPIERKRMYNVVGKFADHEMIDGAATTKAHAEGKHVRVMRTIVVLRERVVKDATGNPSNDETVTPVKYQNQESLIRRYPDAWDAFQAAKKAVSDSTPSAPLPAKKRPGRPKKANVEATSGGGAQIVELNAARG